MNSNVQIEEDNKKLEEEENISNENNLINDEGIFNNLKLILKNDISKFENLLKFNDKEIIFNDKLLLSKIINELILLDQMVYGNLLISFISPPCHKLLEAYINSDLDEEESIKSIDDFKYIKIFEILKHHLFISRENISLIYSYFSSIFHDAKKIEENDKRLSKFLKMIELWKIFYTLPINKNESTFSFIGGKLIFKLKEAYDFSKKRILIKINFIENEYFLNQLDNIIFLKLNDIEINIKEYLKDLKDINNMLYMKFLISNNKIDFNYKIEGKEEKIKKIKTKFSNVNTITILENFFGQIKSIEITLMNNILERKNQSNVYYPIPTNENNVLFNFKKINQKEKYFNNKDQSINGENFIDLTTTEDLYELKIDNNKLVRINYINYHKENYQLFEYFGGLTQLLPFMSLIKTIYENEKIKFINNQSKIEILSYFFAVIMKSFINIIFHYQEYKKMIQKYFLFVLCIIVELDSKLFSKKDIIIEMLNKTIITNQTLSIIMNYFLKILNMEIYENKNESVSFLRDTELNVCVPKLNNYEYFFGQLYKHLMKELFIYNNNWSNKEIFYNKNENDNTISIKYKQINYYTKSFQQPFIYPILEIDKYYPEFNDFNKDNLFKNEADEILKYDFSLSDNNIIIEEIKKCIRDKEKSNIEFEKCCLVKKIYHVKGKLGVMKKNKDDSFKILFISNDKEEEYTCNKHLKIEKTKHFQINKKFDEKNKYVCYGSICRCPKKEYNRKIIIKSEDILFLLVREYYHRVSGIEIFTNNNKSYYFNFNRKFEAKIKFKKKEIGKHIENVDNNNINDAEMEEDNDNIEVENTLIKENKNVIILNINKDFGKIIRNKILLGFYNKKYQRYFYPLFENKIINQTEFKSKYFSNFDILIYINLLANRSFKDLFQYPIFPMFYNIIGKKRDMKKHIGQQELDDQSKDRYKLIIRAYESTLEDSEEDNDNSNPIRLFNTNYSNPTYVSNFLIRALPYSFSCIDLQGDGFDDPNRLFYAIDLVMNNTLNQKSDVRELIPEFFYFFEIFVNRNNLKFNKLINKEEIDKVKIFHLNKEAKDKDIFAFIADMRNLLEKEEKLNEWIDLIFGVKSLKDEKNRLYFSDETRVNFECNDELLKDKIFMHSTDFGIIPFKLYNSKFPSIKKNKLDILKRYNNLMVDYEHYSSDSNSMKSCMCIGRTQIEKEYLNCYNNNNHILDKYINRTKEIDDSCFYFIGDIFGNVTIYRINTENEDKNIPKFRRFSLIHKREKNKDMKNKIVKSEEEIKKYYAKIDRITDDNLYQVTVFKKLYHHNKRVKFIDFNRRLNLFATYGLDGFINLYLFPTCKLINSIKITNIAGDQCIFDKIFLISTPFPMILCLNKIIVYILDINGNFIHVESIADEKIQIFIDNNCGIVQDFLIKDEEIYYFPFLDKEDK